MSRYSCAPRPNRREPEEGGVDTRSSDFGKIAGRDGSIEVDLDVDSLRQRLAGAGDPAHQIVYGYIIDSVYPDGRLQSYKQRGSAPNWDGGFITLCTCKHSMRASKTPSQWEGKWVAGLTGYNQRFGYRQSLVTLYRVGEAYGSHAELVHAFRQTGRDSGVEAKDASVHRLGDLMVPRKLGIPPNPHDPSGYKTPCLPHAHRATEDDDGWKHDIHYDGRSPRQPAMLVGDPESSFRWTRPFIQRRRPAGFRMHRLWSLLDFLDDIEGVPA